MADSRNKGAAFERDLVKRLNTFFADNQFDISFKGNLVCVPIYAISPGYERDNAQTVVMTLDQWFIFLKKYLEAANEGR